MLVKHTIRTKRGSLKKVELDEAEAIRLFCIECCGFNEEAAKDCGSQYCPLRPFSLNEEK
jgi:predicted DNA-binding protein (UPF0251 family)